MSELYMKSRENDSNNNKTREGFNEAFDLTKFSANEQAALKRFATEWYLTNSGNPIQILTSEYKYFLIKPTQRYTEMFNIEREVLCVFSSYKEFEPRTLDAYDAAQKRLSKSNLRLESVCRVLISADPEIEKKTERLLKNDPEQPIVIPFYIEDLVEKNLDPYLIQNRFRRNFYSRDLFDFRSPLKKDLYFFGRTALVHEITNRHRSGEHTGLFGLRKSGKTSIIYAVERALNISNEDSLVIDCESPSVHKLRWFELLHKLISDIKRVKNIDIQTSDLSNYVQKTAADIFEKDLLRIFQNAQTPILVVFDEIERISPDTGASDHWRLGDDFVFFWQTLRAFFQRHAGIVSYMLVGTNPAVIEKPRLRSHENPLFASMTSQYVPSFSHTQVREMVRRLGRYMGMQFDESIFSRLSDDFGGHPFLIRQFCSYINKTSNIERPLPIDKALYEKKIIEFRDQATDYLDMIVDVLRTWYPDEYDMLVYLAQGDIDTFTQFAQSDSQYTRHLIGYGLVQLSQNGVCFNIDCLKDYLSKKHKYQRLNLTDDEKMQECSSRRNNLEKRFRNLIRQVMHIKHGKKSIDKILECLPTERRAKYAQIDTNRLLDKDNSPLFLLDLVSIFDKHWDDFVNVFSDDKVKVLMSLKDINSYGRPDAHAKKIGDDEFSLMRIYFNRFEKMLDSINDPH